jgi:hypothetical protein
LVTFFTEKKAGGKVKEEKKEENRREERGRERKRECIYRQGGRE